MARKASTSTTAPVTGAKASAKSTGKAPSRMATPSTKTKATAAPASKAPAAAPRAKASAKPASKVPSKASPVSPKKAAARSAPPRAPEIVTLRQLATRLGEEHELTQRQAQSLLTGVVDLLVEHLKAEDKLRLKGLGVLEVKNRPARTARNPATGAPVQVAASKKITFRPAKDLKEAI